MSKMFTGGTVCRELESEAPAADEMLDPYIHLFMLVCISLLHLTD